MEEKPAELPASPSQDGPVSEQETQIQPASFWEKLKIHKFKILGGVLGVLVLVSIVFGAYKLGQRSIYPEPVEGPTPTPIVEATPTPLPSEAPAKEGDPTVNWKTYTFSFWSIRLPPGVSNFRCDQSSCLTSSTILSSGATLSVSGGGPDTVMGTSWEEVLSVMKKKNISYQLKTVSTKPAYYINTNDYEFFPFETSAKGNGPMVGIVMPIRESGWISLYLYNKDENFILKPIPLEDLSIFDLILSTFKFLE
ncbi:MAG: hypothetical protein ACOZBZ_00745 [Patescibacteria group bacterium]